MSGDLREHWGCVQILIPPPFKKIVTMPTDLQDHLTAVVCVLYIMDFAHPKPHPPTHTV